MNDWLVNLVIGVASIATGAIGAWGVSALKIRGIRKEQDLANETTASEQWKGLYDEMKKDRDASAKLVNYTNDQIAKSNDQIAKSNEQIAKSNEQLHEAQAQNLHYITTIKELTDKITKNDKRAKKQ